MQFDYDQLRALNAICTTGSFEHAAAQIGVTASAVSQRLKALEERVGARLIVRGTPCRATDLGQRLARHMEDVALMEARLSPNTDGPPQVSIAVNADSLATWIVPALAAVRDIRFNIIVDDQDHSAELLSTGAAACAITARAAPVHGCDVISLGALPYVATASPAFAGRWFSQGVTADALRAAPALIYDRKDTLQAIWARREAGAPVRLTGHMVPSTTAFVAAAKAGLGWGMNPEALVRAALAEGSLVELGTKPAFETPLFWQITRHMKAPLSELTRAIQTSAQQHLIAPPHPSR